VLGAHYTRIPVDDLRISVQYVKQETMVQTEAGKEARATRLITERASRRIGAMAFELALARPRKVPVPSLPRAFLPYICASQQVTIIHKSNVLSVTDGLFRETVRAVPKLPEVAGRFDSVVIAEQIVDSAVYRFDSLSRTCRKR
jgi:homoisocitrate dehydrogenase